MSNAQSLWTTIIVLSTAPWPAGAGTFPTSFDQAPLLDWIASETNFKPAEVVSVGATDVIAIESVSPSDPATPGRLRLSIHAEIVSAEVAEAEGYLSWRGVMRVDCLRNRLQVQSIRNYAQRGLQGASLDGTVGEDWVEPGMGSQLYSVVRSACDANYPRPFKAVVTAQAEAEALAAHEAAVGSSEEKVVVAATPEADPPSPKPTTSSAAVVQISAAPSADLARQALRTVQARFAAGRDLTPKVERAVVGGRTVFRAGLGGFDSFQDAWDFCRTLKAGAQDCFVKDDRG